MSDVLERLAAANPVSECPQPNLEEFRARFDEQLEMPSPLARTASPDAHSWRRSRWPKRSLRVVVAAAGVAAALTIVALSSQTDSGIPLVQRAYAATDPAGGIVYYLTSTRSSFGSGARASSTESRAQVWRSGSRSRRLETHTTDLRDGQAQQGDSYEEVDERVARGELSSTYSSSTNTVFKGLLAFTGRNPPGSRYCKVSVTCALMTEDPVLALRALYAAGAMHEVGHSQLDGKTLTVLEVSSLKQSRISAQRVLLDPKTGAPVELITQYGSQLGALTSTTIFHSYEHLKLTEQTERLLSFRAHPHARLECVIALHCSHREIHGVDVGHT
jgi:hypothetical protein